MQSSHQGGNKQKKDNNRVCPALFSRSIETSSLVDRAPAHDRYGTVSARFRQADTKNLEINLGV